MRYAFTKSFNVIFRLNDNDGEDVKVFSFSTRWEAKKVYDYCAKYIRDTYKDVEILEHGISYKGDMICCTDTGPYYYVRLVGCDFVSSEYVLSDYFKEKYHV